MIPRMLGLVAALALAPFWPPVSAGAQTAPKIPRVGYVISGTPTGYGRLFEAARQGLRELGYVEGQSIAVEVRWAEGRNERFPELVAGMVRLKVDVMVAVSTPGALAAKSATQTIPVVMVAVGDPVGNGLVASLARPGGNLTGLSLLSSELSGKRLQLLREVLPKVARVAILTNPGNPLHALVWQETQEAARSWACSFRPWRYEAPRPSRGRSGPPRKGAPGPSSPPMISKPPRTDSESWLWPPGAACPPCTDCANFRTTEA